MSMMRMEWSDSAGILPATGMFATLIVGLIAAGWFYHAVIDQQTQT